MHWISIQKVVFLSPEATVKKMIGKNVASQIQRELFSLNTLSFRISFRVMMISLQIKRTKKMTHRLPKDVSILPSELFIHFVSPKNSSLLVTGIAIVSVMLLSKGADSTRFLS